MLRNAIFALGIAAAAVFAAPAAALAVDDLYTPRTPNEPSLSGSSVMSQCIGSVPYINYAVSAVDPDNQLGDVPVSLFITDGTNNVTLALGTLVNDQLSGSVLWPGASADGSTAPLNWTLGSISAELRANPTLSVALSYPQPAAACMGVPAALPIAEAPTGLAATGSDVPLIALGVGAVAVLGGGALMLKRRQPKH